MEYGRGFMSILRSNHCASTEMSLYAEREKQPLPTKLWGRMRMGYNVGGGVYREWSSQLRLGEFV